MATEKLGRGPRPEGWPLVCDICRRAIAATSEQRQWWLDAINPGTVHHGRTGGRLGPNIRVTRCPQHIGDWSIRLAGLPRSKSIYAWAELAVMMDDPTQDIDLATYPLPLDSL